MSAEGYKRAIYQMQQDLLEQGWDDVEVRKSKTNPANYELVVKKNGYKATVLTALQSFGTMWASRIHSAVSASTMLNTMQRKLDDLNRDLMEKQFLSLGQLWEAFKASRVNK